MAKIDISDGEKPATDAGGGATRSVVNFTIDAVGASHVRPGLVDQLVTGLTASPVIGAYVWQRWLVLVTADRRLWAIDEAAPTAAVALSNAVLTTQLDGSSRPVFSSDSLRVVVAGGGAIQTWGGVGLSARLGATAPIASHVVCVGNRLVANQIGAAGLFWWSQLGDGNHATWDPLAFAVADADPDPVIAVTSSQREVWVMGPRTVQVYGVGVDPLQPYEPINTMYVGCGAPYSTVAWGSLVGWLNDRGQIVIGDGHSEPMVISNDISEQIRGFTVVEDCWGYRRDQGHDTHLIWVFPTEKRSFVYDVTDKTWMEEAFYDTVTRGQTAMPISCFVRWEAQRANLCGSSLTGALYRYDSDAATDLGGPIVAERVTGVLDHGTKHRKRSSAVTVDVRRGAGGGTSWLELRVKDDGEPWGDWEPIEVASGELEPIVKAWLGGVFRKRQYHLRYTGADEMAIVGLEDDVTDIEQPVPQ